MKIYGCDFSGAKDPSEKIYVTTEGVLSNNHLTITNILNCEERLDVFHLIKTRPAPWGLNGKPICFIYSESLDDIWDSRPSFATDAEWDRKSLEGLIVRIG